MVVNACLISNEYYEFEKIENGGFTRAVEGSESTIGGGI
jgi:hypothetical protein